MHKAKEPGYPKMQFTMCKRHIGCIQVNWHCVRGWWPRTVGCDGLGVRGASFRILGSEWWRRGERLVEQSRARESDLLSPARVWKGRSSVGKAGTQARPSFTSGPGESATPAFDPLLLFSPAVQCQAGVSMLRELS